MNKPMMSGVGGACEYTLIPEFQRDDAPSRGQRRLQGSTQRTASMFIRRCGIYTQGSWRCAYPRPPSPRARYRSRHLEPLYRFTRAEVERSSLPQVTFVTPGEGVMRCSRCQFDNFPTMNFCVECGSRLDLRCPQC